jgi:hypothetical protein
MFTLQLQQKKPMDAGFSRARNRLNIKEMPMPQ